MIERLQAEGVAVTAPANPLRGIATDSAYLAGVFKETPGPGASGGEPAVEFAMDSGSASLSALGEKRMHVVLFTPSVDGAASDDQRH